MSTTHEESAALDVADVGDRAGRPAGASLAARLGKAGLRVVVVDRDDFPPCLRSRRARSSIGRRSR